MDWYYDIPRCVGCGLPLDPDLAGIAAWCSLECYVRSEAKQKEKEKKGDD